MKMNQNIDELLSSFIDGELAESRQSEIRRLIADDPQVARRLRELQACKALVSSLPRAKAPAGILNEVKASLQARVPQSQQPVYSAASEIRRFVLVRRVVAAAAVIALIAVLSVVIQALIPHDIAPGPLGADARIAAGGFSGRLEFRTAAPAQVGPSIPKAIHDNGLSDRVVRTQVDGRKVYSLRCNKEALNVLLADLDSVWQRFDSATLFVDTEQFGKPIVIHAVTAEQTAEVINQDDFKACTELARDFAVLNNVAESMPGREVTAVVDGGPTLPTIPKPSLASHEDTMKDSASSAEDGQKVSLTIVVSGTK